MGTKWDWETVLGISFLFLCWWNLIMSKSEFNDRATTILLCKVIKTTRRTPNKWIPVITSEKWHWGEW